MKSHWTDWKLKATAWILFTAKCLLHNEWDIIKSSLGVFQGQNRNKEKGEIKPMWWVFFWKDSFYPYVFCFWFLLIKTHNTQGSHIVLSFYKLGPFLITESAVSKKKKNFKSRMVTKPPRQILILSSRVQC